MACCSGTEAAFFDFARLFGCWPSFRCTCSFVKLERDGCSVVCFSMLGFWTAVVFISKSYKEDANISQLATVLEGTSQIAFSLLPLIISILRGPAFHNAFRSLNLFDKKLPVRVERSSKLSSFLITYNTTFLVSISVICLPVLPYFVLTFHGSKTWTITAYATYCFMAAFPTCFVLQFAAFCYLMGKRFELVAKQMQFLLNRKGNVSDVLTEPLQNARLLHVELCDVAKSFMKIFSPILFLITSGYLCTIVVTGYYTISASLKTTATMLFRIANCGVELVIAFWAADRLKQKGTMISSVMKTARLSTLTPADQNELIFFSSQLASDKLNTKVLGMFDLGLHLIPSIVAAVITYLVILKDT